MSPKDRDILEKINRIAMRSEGRTDLIRSIDIYAENRDTLKRIADDSRLSENARKIARKMLEDPRMYKTMEQVNQEKAARVEASVERDIKRAIKQGYLADPSESVGTFMQQFDS